MCSRRLFFAQTEKGKAQSVAINAGSERPSWAFDADGLVAGNPPRTRRARGAMAGGLGRLLYLSVITIGELCRGITGRPESHRRDTFAVFAE